MIIFNTIRDRHFPQCERGSCDGRLCHIISKMTNLVVFDFDRTIVDDDSDATIIRRLQEKKPPPEWDSTNHDWTPYMSGVFEHAYSSGLSQEDILDCIASMPPTPGVIQLITELAAAKHDVVLITDANTVFVNHWLKTHGLEDAVTKLITNEAHWLKGRLYLEPYMKQAACTHCPSNLCKSLALAQWCVGRNYEKIAYVGDGRNDYCPASNLSSAAIVFPRRGYKLHDLIKKTLSTPEPEVKAKVVAWDNCYTILKELLPDRAQAKPVCN